MTSLRWALYLGVSWTWCIGMYLPVLLLRDYGFWAYFAFALPNILGAAAMGWTIPNAEASERIVRDHRSMAILFSRWTFAFQAFFAGWMVTQLIGWWTALLYPLLILIFIFAIRKDRDFSLISLLAFLFSLACAATLGYRCELHLPEIHASFDPLFVAPVCLLGFLFCPYLDLTFHHALQSAFRQGEGDKTSRTAFTVGFCIVFASMILFTLLYATVLRQSHGKLLIGFHMLVQLTVTLAFHHLEAGRAARKPLSLWTWLLIPFAIGLASRFIPVSLPWQLGEYLYRTFLAGYGLLFPAYVLFHMLPSRPFSNTIFAATLLLALPFFAWGFYTPNPQPLLPATVIVLGGWLLAWGLKDRQGRSLAR